MNKIPEQQDILLKLVILSGKVEMLQWLVDEKNIDVDKHLDCLRLIPNEIIDVSMPLVAYAANSGQFGILKWLVDKRDAELDVMVNYTDQWGQYDGWSLITYAVKELFKLDIVKYLVDKLGTDCRTKWVSEDDYSSAGSTDSLIVCASQHGRWDVVRWLVDEKSVEVNQTGGYHNWSILTYAVRAGQLDIVKWLIDEKGFDIKDIAKGHDGQNILSHAVEAGQLDIVKWLVETQGADVNMVVKTGDVHAQSEVARPLVMYAATKNKWNIVKWLVDEKGVDINHVDSKKKNIFIHAVGAGEIDIVKWLVDEKGADINVGVLDDTTQEIFTLLAYATKCGKLDMVKWLVEEKSADIMDIRVKNYGDVHGIDLITPKDKPKSASYSAGATYKWDAEAVLAAVPYIPQNVVAREEQHTYVSKSIGDGILVVPFSKCGAESVLGRTLDTPRSGAEEITLLAYAVKHGKWDIVRWLGDEKNADINIIVQDSDLRTKDTVALPLILYAAKAEQWGIVKWLVDEKGADVNQVDNKGNNILTYAVEVSEWNIVKWLGDEKGVDVNITVKSSIYDEEITMSLIAYAAKAEQWDIVRWLSDTKGADINIILFNKSLIKLALDPSERDESHKTRWDIVKWLADEKGADINITVKGVCYNSKNRGEDMLVAIASAVEEDRWDIVKWLVDEKGIDPNISVWKDNMAVPLLACALVKDRWDIVKWLVEKKGVDVNRIDSHGQHILSYMIKVDHCENIVKWLVDEKGVDANVVVIDDDKNGNSISLIEYAAQEGQWHVVKWLISEKDVDINSTVKNILSYAAEGHNWDIVKYCVIKGTNITPSNVRELVQKFSLDKKCMEAVYLNIKANYGEDAINIFMQSFTKSKPIYHYVQKFLITGEEVYYSGISVKLGGGINPASVTLKSLQEKRSVIDQVVPSLKQLCVSKVNECPKQHFDPLCKLLGPILESVADGSSRQDVDIGLVAQDSTLHTD